MEIIAEFKYNQKLSSIKCNIKEKFGEIIEKYKSKEKFENKPLNFLYSGTTIKEGETIEDLLKDDNGKTEKIQIIVESKGEEKNFIVKSKSIICPKCKEDIRLKMKDYKIYLYDCKNGHKIGNILLNEFEETQKLDLSKFICNLCNNENKKSINNKKCFYCFSCKLNICQICKENHDKKHLISDIENKNLSCHLHNKESFIKYCNQCKLNLCFSCLEHHQGHDIILYESIKPDINKIKEEFKKMRNTLDKFNANINQIKKCLNTVQENFEIYYNIYNDLISNYEKFETNERNYEIFQNL